MISIIVSETGSTRICIDTLKLPAASQVYAVERCERSDAFSPATPKNATTAPAKPTKTLPVEISAAVPREM